MSQRIARWLENLFLLSVVFFVISCPFSKRVPKIALAAGFTFLLACSILRFRLRFYRAFLSSIPSSKPLLLFFLWVAVSAIFSLNFSHSKSIFLDRYLLYFFFFLFGIQVAKERRFFIVLLSAFLASAFMLGIGGALDFFRFHPYRLYSVFNRSVNFTPYLVIYIPFCCAVCFFSEHKLVRGLAILSVGLLFPCLIWNASRAGWVAVSLAILTCAFLKSRRTAFLLAIIMLIGFIILPMQMQVRKRAGETFQPQEWGRWDLWRAAVEICIDFPVFGAGPGMFEKLLARYHVPFPNTSNSPEHLHAHSTYLEISSELGIPGCFLFVSLLVCFFKKVWHALKVNVEKNVGLVLLDLTSSLFATLILASAATILVVGAQDAAMFWFLLGATTGIAQLIRSGAASNVLKPVSTLA